MMYLRRWGIGVGRLHVTWLDLWARARLDLDPHLRPPGFPWYRGLGLWIEWEKR